VQDEKKEGEGGTRGINIKKRWLKRIRNEEPEKATPPTDGKGEKSKY
jgi:hypothetical protein